MPMFNQYTIAIILEAKYTSLGQGSKRKKKEEPIAHHKVCAGSNLFAHKGPLNI